MRSFLLAGVALAALPFVAHAEQAALPPGPSHAQHLVDVTIAAHSAVLVLAIHALPADGNDAGILASNIGRIGKPADEQNLGELPRLVTAPGAKTGVVEPERNAMFVAVSPGESKSMAQVLRFSRAN